MDRIACRQERCASKGQNPVGIPAVCKGPRARKAKNGRPGLFKQGLGEFSHTASFTKSKKDVQVIGGIVRFRYGAAKVIFA